MSAQKVLTQVAQLEEMLTHGSPRPWWVSHGEVAAGDKSLWDEYEALDDNPDLPEPEENGRQWELLSYGDAKDQHDSYTIVAAVNNLPALLELKRAAAEWAVALREIHKETFIGPGPHPELQRFQELEHRLAELALVVMEGVE